MNTGDGDGIDEALQGVTQVALTAAARIGEQLARARERGARDAQARSEQAAHEYAERMRAERSAARAALAPVHRSDWWDAATGEEATHAYQTARAWSTVDPEAAHAEQRIVQEVRARYGVDLGRGELEAVQAISSVEQTRPAGSQERAQAGQDTAGAVALMAAADAKDARAVAAANRAAAAEMVTLETMTAAAALGDEWARQRAERQLGDQALGQGVVEAGNIMDAGDLALVRSRTDLTLLTEWWDSADPAVIPLLYTHARSWAEVDPEVRRAEERIVKEVRTRYGVDLGRARTDETGLAEVAESESTRTPEYDTAERRAALASELEHVDNRAAVEARLHADLAQARPAREAVQRPTAGRAQSGRSNPGRGRSGHAVQRGDRGR